MEKRYQVFVSSTFTDLQEERRQVIQALLELDCIPAGMELFPASDEQRWELIKRVISDCDYYIVIIGGRYGSVDDVGISYTEREYDYAVERNIPVLAFVHAKPCEIPAGKTELSPEAQERLTAFRAKVEQRMCKKWVTAEDLGGVVSRGLVQSMKLKPAEGWVRARFATDAEGQQRLRSQIEALTAELESVRTKPPSDALKLASGADKIVVHYRVREGERSWLSYTWDGIFGCVGPLMFNEASESDIRARLARRIANDSAYGGHPYNIAIDEDDFQTIKVQLQALGLIEGSKRNHSLKDSQDYWSLTPYGRHYVTILLARPKTTGGPASTS